MKTDAAQLAILALDDSEFNAASDAPALPLLMRRVSCRVPLQQMLQKQAVLNGSEGVVQPRAENKRVVVWLTRLTGETMGQWKVGFNVMTDRMQCMSLFEGDA